MTWTATLDSPLRLTCHANARMHWRVALIKKKDEKHLTRDAWRLAGSPVPPSWPCTVRLVRLAPRKLDDDNLQSAFKYVRDEVAKCLGLKSDAGPEVVWLYEQRKGKPGEYRVRIEMEAPHAAPSPQAPDPATPSRRRAVRDSAAPAVPAKRRARAGAKVADPAVAAVPGRAVVKRRTCGRCFGYGCDVCGQDVMR